LQKNGMNRRRNPSNSGRLIFVFIKVTKLGEKWHMLRYFRDYAGMVISMVMSLSLSLCMSVVAFLRAPEIHFTVETLIRNWGAAYLSITIVSLIIPVKVWGDRLAALIRLKQSTFLFGLVANLVPTLFFNTAITCVEVGVNISGGFSSLLYWNAVASDYLPMLMISYILSLGAEKIGLTIARKVCGDHPQWPHV